MPGSKFYFATYQFEGTLPLGVAESDESHEEVLDRILRNYMSQQQPVAVTEDAAWYFGAVTHDGDYSYGKFGKEFAENPEEYDQDEGDFLEDDEENIDSDYSIFYIDRDKQFLAFHATYRVRNRNFIKFFDRGFQQYCDGQMHIEFKLIENEERFDTVIQEHPVHKVDAELEPSNPSPREEWEDLDESMRNMLVDTLEITAEQYDEEGLNLSEEFISQVLSMTQSQYGETWEITYSEDGEFKVISSDDEEPIIKEYDEKPDSVDWIRGRGEELKEYAQMFLTW